MSEDYRRSNLACVQGYQWHVLNKSENWITRAVRSEYAGSYVVERSGAELLGALKMIAGSVYMVRRDLLDKFGWGTSITEDFQLTLRLYEAGYKVVHTPYIQAPAECVSTFRRLIRQRMRWAEGHSHNVRKMFVRLLFGSSPLTFMEKLEFLYLSPYYLQAFFFLAGTTSWLLAETIFPARLPFWTSLWGWSLVLTNFLSLPLMNAVGLFLEEGEERDYLGLLSFVALSYILVPFQAYASFKGFLEKEEGPWFRTPKTGRITDIFTRGRFYRLIAGILPDRQTSPAIAKLLNGSIANQFNNLTMKEFNPYLALSTANSRFDSFTLKPKRMRWVGKLMLVFVLTLSLLVHSMAINPTPVEATWYDTGYLYRKKLTIDNTLVSGIANHSSFPVLVSYSDADLRTTADGGKVENTNGWDIVFTDDDKTTKFDHEIEDYTSNATTGTIVMWVRFPTLPYNVDKDFYIYYGNSSITTSQENVTGTWNTNYKGAWHLHDDFLDSTLNNNDGTNSGSTDAAGKVGDGQSFNGTSAYIDLGNPATLNFSTGDWTIEFWGKTAAAVAIVGYGNGGDDTPGVRHYLGLLDNTPQADLITDDDTNKYVVTSGVGNTYNDGLWHHFVGHRQGTTLRLYMDGAFMASATTITGYDLGLMSQCNANIGAGRSVTGCALIKYWTGEIDGVRVLSTALSADWIATEFNNQDNQGTGSGKFIKTLGTEEEVPELVVLLLPVALLVPFLVKRLRRRGRLGFVSLDVSARWPISQKTLGFRRRRWIRGP